MLYSFIIIQRVKIKAVPDLIDNVRLNNSKNFLDIIIEVDNFIL